MTAAVSLSRNDKTEQRIVEKLLQDADPRFRPASDGGARFTPAGAVQVTRRMISFTRRLEMTLVVGALRDREIFENLCLTIV